ncbi:hypothetical protein ACJ41O_001892 [Fusarium nematophilum]
MRDLSPNGPLPTQGIKYRRPHRKSRSGCSNCKRRKVKVGPDAHLSLLIPKESQCDETKPMCSNCVRFGIPCSFNPLALVLQEPAAETPPKGSSEAGSPSHKPTQQRGPGRPRKDWAALGYRLAQTTAPAKTKPPRSSGGASSTSSSSLTLEHEACSLNVADAELMLHYVHRTAGSLGRPGRPEDPMAVFWRYNVPRIGISHHFVLRLVYAFAGFHLAHLEPKESRRRARYLSLARQHSEAGLRQLNETLLSINESNCGALYVSALLVSYCAFAAGPTGSGDLLICNVGEEATQNQLPLIHGVRMIRQTIEPATLFTGLMAPLGDPGPDKESPAPTHPSIDWAEPVARLREWVTAPKSADTVIYDQALASLAAVYEANYGSEGASSSNRLVLGWLYRLQDLYLSFLKQRRPQALLILAYFAPLLKIAGPCWFLGGWPEHILESIRGMLSEELLSWLEWPTRAVLTLSDGPVCKSSPQD